MTPLEKYQIDMQSGEFTEDPAQAQAIQLLDDLYQRLVKANQPKGFFANLTSVFSNDQLPEKGLYFWGGVGRGKTYLMDMFYDQLPFENKMRLHFHRFMHQLHEQLTTHKGQRDPLIKIADDIAQQTCVICFDEFFVSDITDAMLLGGLFEALFERGVSLVATSNIPPERLYWNGLQRERFIPAIKLIQQHTQVVNVDGGIDYRLRTLEQADIFHCPHDQEAIDNLNYSFEHLSTEEQPEASSIEVEHRQIQTVRCAEGVVWFRFSDICETARSHTDYIELSRCYHTVIVSEIPQLESKDDSAARRFISMVDEFYERNVKLMLTAAVRLEELYLGNQLAFEFKRTLSRLQEMQSHDYLAKEHLA
ncbi:cell division protein ZapE [Aliikangiella coralliicola]|uniref:Cell division protein ZapE n=1 Tax=Aliikangiella coralliicola TaxID=2592383 RepID=A0A545UK95_9GAMM|nr:cell division protein ZapE [Aliikangiella coralliicola]TQV89884.1 AFG1 family ATPase [Aliikangiella coralliicola]